MYERAASTATAAAPAEFVRAASPDVSSTRRDRRVAKVTVVTLTCISPGPGCRHACRFKRYDILGGAVTLLSCTAHFYAEHSQRHGTHSVGQGRSRQVAGRT